MTDTKLPVKIAKNIKLCSDITRWARDFGLDDDFMSASEACEMLEQGVEYFDAIARAEERERVRGIFDALPRKFWEDQDHAVGGYISKKDLRDLLSSLDEPVTKKD